MQTKKIVQQPIGCVLNFKNAKLSSEDNKKTDILILKVNDFDG